MSSESHRRESKFGWKNQQLKSDGEGEFLGQLQPGRAVPDSKEQDHTVFSVRYSPNGQQAAATYGNGCVRIFETDTFTTLHRLRSLTHNTESLPATSVRWRPHCPTKTSDFAVSCASGVIQNWSLDEDVQNDPEYISSMLEPGNETTCLDYSPDGNMLASAGSDHAVRIYDCMSGKQQIELKSGIDERGYSREGHTSRIFSVRVISPTCVVSAGWENACQVWDLRTGRSERQLHGTHVCGDALEVNHNTSTVVVSSYRAKDQIRIFDLLTGRDCTPPNLSENIGESSLYASKLGPDQSTLYCVGSKPNSVFAIDIRTGAMKGQIKGYVVQVLSK